MSTHPSVDEVWSRISNCGGTAFSTKTGKTFKYSVSGNLLRPNCANQNLSKGDFAKALNLWPLDGPGKISNLVRGSAYVWAILNDHRILGDGMAADSALMAEPRAGADPTEVSRAGTPAMAPIAPVDADAETIGLKSEYSAFAADFTRVSLRFSGGLYGDVFGAKNNKSLAQTLQHHRYSKLAPEVVAHFPDQLEEPLGEFLASLKARGDSFYTKFLNPYGDLSYCTFRIADVRYLALKGIYAYTVGRDLKYIGRCRDSMNQRVNQGYGKIHPKNCFLDGQATNCHLNAEIAQVADNVSLWMHPMTSVPDIEREEGHLIRTYRPPWNVQRG